MPENPRGISPLDWRALVNETLRRRKAERLTQREHAALASVSIPTIVAFDRGDRSLTLAKAFDILRVVGLIEEEAEDGAQEAFVKDAFARWRELTASMPDDSPGRFPHGWYRFDYALEGDLKTPELHRLLPLLEKAEIRHTGWPMFVTLNREDLAPYEKDGVIECWVKPEQAGVERVVMADAAHCDFWRVAPAGRAFLIRGYQEDSQDGVPPGTVLDISLPVWRIAEALLHAARLAALLRADEKGEVTVHFRALYTGLAGRVMRLLRAGPDLLSEGRPAKSDEAMLETIVPVRKIESALAEAVYPLASSLAERFGVARLSPDFVHAEIERFRKGKF